MPIDPEGFEAVVLTKLASIETTLKGIADHGTRLTELEAMHNTQNGFIKAVVWVGGILWAIMGFLFGAHILKAGK